MSRPLALFAIGLIFGGGAGYLTAASSGAELEGHAHGSDDHGRHAVIAGCESHDGGHAGHDIAVEAEGPAPTLAIALTPDPVSGWNLRLDTTNFRFAPEHAGCADIAGEGHAHLYVNGEKTARLYAPWAHVASLPGGGAEVKVTLNANGHSPIAVNGEVVEAAMRVMTPAAD